MIFPLQLDSAFCSTEQSDPKVQRLETLISSGYRFTKTFSFGGDASLPSLWSSSKRKLQCCNSTSSGSEVHSPRLSRKFYKNSKVFNSVEDVDGMVTSKIKDFKEALMADLGELLCHSNKGDSSHESTAFSASLHASGCTCPPFRVTHSECVGFHGHFDATKSFYVPEVSLMLLSACYFPILLLITYGILLSLLLMYKKVVAALVHQNCFYAEDLFG